MSSDYGSNDSGRVSSQTALPNTAEDEKETRFKGRTTRNRFGSSINLRLVTLALVLASWIAPARLDEHDHEYKNNEEVILWMNTVGPYHNRQETYSYFSLPFCKGSKPTIGHYHETLGEALQVKRY